MRASSFGAFVLVILVVVAVVFLLVPQERRNSASLDNPVPLWPHRR